MPPTLLPNPSLVRLDYLSAAESLITLVLVTTAPEADCPLCHCASRRIHSRYVRTLADLPWNGVPVRVRLTVRRFFCDMEDCRRRIFAERVPGVTAPHGRRTLRLTEALELIAFALGGEAGARVVQGLGMSGSADTLLRVIRAADRSEPETPHVLGVDDFAFRRGRRYGTILIDLERHCRVDLLPDRSAESLAAWLAEHPGVEVISRDRGGTYADGSRQGAPAAVQVADRFHVLVNLREALERLLTRQHRCLHEAAAVLARQEREKAEAEQPESGESEPVAPRLTWHQRQSAERRDRRIARYEEVRRLRAEGLSLRAIGHVTGLARKTVRQFASAETFPERSLRAYASAADPFDAYLRRRWDEGCQNAALLWQEIHQQGYTGSRSTLRDRLARWRTDSHHPGRPQQGSRSPPAPPAVRARSPRQGSWLLVHPAVWLDDENRAYLDQLVELSSDVAAAYSLAQTFGRIVRERDHAALEAWLVAAEASDLPEMAGFAAGIRRDRQAVDQMLLSAWSNGQTEGQINRLKMLKRQMYGRAKFDLLRQRVLRAS